MGPEAAVRPREGLEETGTRSDLVGSKQEFFGTEREPLHAAPSCQWKKIVTCMWNSCCVVGGCHVRLLKGTTASSQTTHNKSDGMIRYLAHTMSGKGRRCNVRGVGGKLLLLFSEH